MPMMLDKFVSFLLRHFLWVIGLLFVLFWIAVRKDPFFGDGISTVSRASFHIMDSGYTDFTYPDGQDPGHPTLFPLIHALLWSIFGKSLAVSHLFNVLFGFGIVVIVYRWMTEETNPMAAMIASLLLMVTPLFLAQTAMINTHLALSFLVLWTIYALYKHYKYQAVIAATLLLLCHLQGIFYLGGIVAWWFFVRLHYRPIAFRIKKALKLLVVPTVVFVGWLVYHYQMKGWWMSAPSTDFYGRGFGGLKISIVNLIVAFWRMIDYGQIAFLIPFALLFFRKKLFKSGHRFLYIFLILFLLNAILLSFSTTLRSAHRYFLPALPFLVLAAVQAWDAKGKKWWMYVMLLVLVSGHVWQYPGRTVGDATLSYRNIFPLLEEMNEITEEKGMYTYSPLSDANEFAYLNESPLRLKSLYDTNIQDVNYVIRSNVSGDFSPEELNLLENKWNSHTIAEGNIYLTLYVNPKTDTPVEQPMKRQISGFEKWFIQMKKRLRGE